MMLDVEYRGHRASWFFCIWSVHVRIRQSDHHNTTITQDMTFSFEAIRYVTKMISIEACAAVSLLTHQMSVMVKGLIGTVKNAVY
jgi:hypothetical protein